MLHLDQIWVLHTLNKARKDGKEVSGKALVRKHGKHDQEKLVALCRELAKNGYFDDLGDFDKNCINFNNEIGPLFLSYRGMTYAREVRNELFKNIFSWFSDHLIELLALIISIIALLNTKSAPV